MSPVSHPIGRRALLARIAGAVAAAGPLAALAAAQEPLAGQGDAGRLRDPSVAGRPRSVTTAADNDATIQQIERQLKCTCGCNLDIFTCRTTDFSCTYSPELHREVLALAEDGNTPQQIIDAFVAKYGERALMAPKPVSFNLVGYLLPGVAILTGGAALAWVIARRTAAPGAREGVAVPAVTPGFAAGEPPPDAEELERLQRELAEVDD
jgi:cytochrome c-type biogenesis protein CcmH/NrfF